MAQVDLMAAFYAAVTAVEEGKVAEIEIESAFEEMGREERLTITVRSRVRDWFMSHDDEHDDG